MIVIYIIIELIAVIAAIVFAELYFKTKLKYDKAKRIKVTILAT